MKYEIKMVVFDGNQQKLQSALRTLSNAGFGIVASLGERCLILQREKPPLTAQEAHLLNVLFPKDQEYPGPEDQKYPSAEDVEAWLTDGPETAT